MYIIIYSLVDTFIILLYYVIAMQYILYCLTPSGYTIYII